MSRRIYLSRPSVASSDVVRMKSVLNSGWLAGLGPETSAAERSIALISQCERAVAVSSCGAALFLVLRALGVRPGDEVIVADYTYPATAHAVVWQSGVPVFADVLPGKWTIDPASVLSKITPRTVGIIAVDIFGMLANYASLEQIARRHGLFLVADAACAIGARRDGRAAGSFGDAATFSFHGRKVVTCGEGGAIVTNRRDLADKCALDRSYGGVKPSVDGTPSVSSFESPGYNWRMSEILAAILNSQLERLSNLLKRRQEVADYYLENLSGLDGVRLPTMTTDATASTWQSFVLTFAESTHRDQVRSHLRRVEIESTIGAYACHQLPLYASGDDCPVSARAHLTQLAIPMHSELTKGDVDRICTEIRSAVQKKLVSREN